MLPAAFCVSVAPLTRLDATRHELTLVLSAVDFGVYSRRSALTLVEFVHYDGVRYLLPQRILALQSELRSGNA